MNVWSGLPRSLASSRCLNVSSSSIIRHFSTNTPASTDKSPEDSHNLSKLLKEAYTQADSQLLAQHSPPRLQSISNGLTLSPFKRPKRKKKGSKGEKEAASKDEAETKSTEEPETITESVLYPRKRAGKGKQRGSHHFSVKPIPKRRSQNGPDSPQQQLRTLVNALPKPPSETSPSPSDPPTIPYELPSSQDPYATISVLASEPWAVEPWETTGNPHVRIIMLELNFVYQVRNCLYLNRKTHDLAWTI